MEMAQLICGGCRTFLMYTCGAASINFVKQCFLLQLISSRQAEKSTSFSSSMMRIFQRGLLRQRDKEAPRLTESGFQFLLMDTNTQLWYIIREYISNLKVYLMR
ncbi:hypothetical protein ES288_D04G026200v1 [Gossypium darwinii]|uniref:RNA polymerase II transcription factor B subunit 2 n=1 Tax=Gossypium darwinii TaxID=34276 RepID=A0A5D2CW99_GOSDA|nr:hypothetical protein ES288_D04G026200v1 [Gossypium darwinii]